jgi:hypothetical protein
MAERRLQKRAAVLVNLREALEIYINAGGREIIGTSLSELTDRFPGWPLPGTDRNSTSRAFLPLGRC